MTGSVSKIEDEHESSIIGPAQDYGDADRGFSLGAGLESSSPHETAPGTKGGRP